MPQILIILDLYDLANYLSVSLISEYTLTEIWFRRGKQNHICANFDFQFVEDPKNKRGYSNEVRKTCLKIYLNGMGFRGIERVTERGNPRI